MGLGVEHELRQRSQDYSRASGLLKTWKRRAGNALGIPTQILLKHQNLAFQPCSLRQVEGDVGRCQRLRT